MPVRIILMNIIALGLVTSSTRGQSWQQCSSLPEPMAPSAVAVNGTIYAVKGSDFYSASLTEPSSMYEYDPGVNVWTKKGSMNTMRTNFGMIELNGKIYVLGGISNNTYAAFVTLADVEAYDISTGLWQLKRSMPKSLYVFGLVSMDGKIYVIGGNSKTTNNGSRLDSTSNRLFEYTPETDTWTERASMQKQRSWSDAVAINHKIYAIGGNNGIPLSGENTIEEFDPASNMWTMKTAFTNGFDGQCQAVAMNGKIYTLSSDITSSGAFTKAVIGEYDPALGTWIEKSQMLSPVMDFGKVVYHDQLYLVGGHPVTAMNYSNKVFKYDPATNSQASLPNISQWRNAVVETGGIIYAIGGVNSSGAFYNRVMKYNTINDPTSVQQPQGKPESFRLDQNYPNPFNPETSIRWEVPVGTHVTLRVSDALGRSIMTLVDEYKSPGTYCTSFSANPLSLASGVYFYTLAAGNSSQTRKMMFMK